MAADNVSGASAPLTRLQGLKGWQVGVIQSDGQRWVTVTLQWLDENMEPVAVTFDPRDAETVAKSLFHLARTAQLRDTGDSN